MTPYESVPMSMANPAMGQSFTMMPIVRMAPMTMRQPMPTFAMQAQPMGMPWQGAAMAGMAPGMMGGMPPGMMGDMPPGMMGGMPPGMMGAMAPPGMMSAAMPTQAAPMMPPGMQGLPAMAGVVVPEATYGAAARSAARGALNWAPLVITGDIPPWVSNLNLPFLHLNMNWPGATMNAEVPGRGVSGVLPSMANILHMPAWNTVWGMPSEGGEDEEHL